MSVSEGQMSEGLYYNVIDYSSLAKNAILGLYILNELERILNGLPWRGFALCECFYPVSRKKTGHSALAHD